MPEGSCLIVNYFLFLGIIIIRTFKIIPNKIAIAKSKYSGNLEYQRNTEKVIGIINNIFRDSLIFVLNLIKIESIQQAIVKQHQDIEKRDSRFALS